MQYFNIFFNFFTNLLHFSFLFKNHTPKIIIMHKIILAIYLERMIYMLATVASLTSANRIKKQCSEYGIYTSVIQTPHNLAKDGCGYSLRFDDSAKSIIEASADNLGIRIRAFYTETIIGDKRTYTAL